MRKTVFRLSTAFWLALVLAAPVVVGPADAQDDNEGIFVLPVQGNVYMLAGAGGNITASVGRDGVLLVDTGSAEMSDQVLETIELLASVTASVVPAVPCVGLSCVGVHSAYGWSSPTLNAIISSPAPPKPIRYIINTRFDPEHTGGNARISSAGVTYTGGNVTGTISDSGIGAAIFSHEDTMLLMSDASVESDAIPTDTYYVESHKLTQFFNGEGVQLFHVPAANSNGDTIVWFRYSDVISAGDIFSTTQYPVIDLEQGGSIQGIIGGLNLILDLAFPEFRAQGGTMVIPGHGRLSDTGDVVHYRNMVSIIRDRVQNMIDQGMTLEQVLEARPTIGYDGRYGTETGPWTTDMFVEAVYESLGSE